LILVVYITETDIIRSKTQTTVRAIPNRS